MLAPADAGFTQRWAWKYPYFQMVHGIVLVDEYGDRSLAPSPVTVGCHACAYPKIDQLVTSDA